MRKTYRIKFKTNKGLQSAMVYLFKLGFVFTDSRINNMRDVKRCFIGEENYWLYIFIGHHECRATFNTSSRSIFHFYGWTEVSFRHFKENILPTFYGTT